MEWSTKNIVVIIGLILTIVSIISPITWDYYTHRSGLEFRIESSNSLLPADPLLKDFLITYQGKPIRNLTRMDCTFVNSGNTPITSDDIMDAPTINIPKMSGVIAAIPLSTDPQNLYANLSININKNEVKIGFSLLNPGDFIRLALYLNGSSNELPSINARIKGIKEVKVINNIQNEVKTNKGKDLLIGNLMVFFKYIGIFIILLFIIVSGKAAFDFRRTKNLLKKNPNLLSEFNDADSIKNFIDKNLSALGSDQKKKLLMKEIEDAEKDFSEDNKSRLIAAINKALNTRSSSETAFIFFVIVAMIVAYFYWPIL
jgi:hypothetical protein